MSDGEQKYWYNSNSGQVEFGYLSPSAERVGPFDTEAEAARAPETLRARAAAWAAEDAREDDWPRTTDSDGK
ncbi:SPOR domain-containing protein [Microbacterium sp.]|uniref:SPOR domain-containing protein n=1 Tax=Microbacterium sp. TaxID=51671 RepID=UPI00262B00E8|nr:SPOR domain-containing protein [Microbacterium sp.]